MSVRAAQQVPVLDHQLTSGAAAQAEPPPQLGAGDVRGAATADVAATEDAVLRPGDRALEVDRHLGAHIVPAASVASSPRPTWAPDRVRRSLQRAARSAASEHQ